MKNFAFLLVLGVLFLTTACGSDNTSNTDTSGTESSGSVTGTENTAPAVSPVAPAVPDPAAGAAAPAPAQASASGQQHYVCPKGCKGSGGAAQGNCPVCGTAYVHNQAFHAQDPKNAASPTQMPTPSQTPEPAQNAAGVWHYTCGKGCPGGGGAAGNCAKCGGPLAHNSAYHNK